MRGKGSADPEHPSLHKVPLGGEEWCCIGWLGPAGYFISAGLGGK